MARKVYKTKRVTISLNDEQSEALGKVMKEYLQTNVSDFFVILLTEKYREGMTKKGKRDEREAEDAQLAIYPHPDTLMMKGKLLTKDELNDWYMAKGLRMPDVI